MSEVSVARQNFSEITTHNNAQSFAGSARDVYFGVVENSQEILKQTCRSALFLTDPAVDRESLISAKGDRVDGTCEWIKSNEKYQAWLNGDTNLLWISGGPGKGKTMLSIFLIDELQKNADTELIYYFCDHQNEKRNTVTAVLRGLLYQILTVRPELIKHASRFFESPERTRQTVASMETLWIILTKFVNDINLRKTYCVLDGLDECEGSQLRALARRLDHLSSPRRTTPNTNSFKVVIVSRPMDGLRKAVQVNLDPDNNEKVASDIEKFIAVRVDELSGIPGFSKIRARVQADLLERAEGTFLWVGFAMYELLQKKTLSQVLNALKVLPMGLEAIYDRMLLQVPDKDKHITSLILRWVTLALRPLKLNELAAAISFQSPHSLITLEQAICDQVMICEPFLKVQDKEVHPAHQSGRDYLFREKGSSDNGVLKYFRIRPEETHLEIARVCLECVAQNLQHGPVDLKNLPNTQSSELLRYAVEYWPEHVKCCSDLAAQLIDTSAIFYQKRSAVRNNWMASYNPGDIKVCEYDPIPLLHMACFFCIIPWVEAILHNRDLWKECGGVTEEFTDGLTPLHLGFENKRITQLLLANGADINARNAIGQTVLHLAIQGETPEETIRRLLESGVDINAKDEDDETALSIATSKYTAIIPLLLEKGADVNITDNRGNPLLFNLVGRNEVAMRMLLETGVRPDVNMKNSDGFSPLHKASYISNENAVRMLLEKRADTNAKDHESATPLHLAFFNMHMEEVLKLREETQTNVKSADELLLQYYASCKSIEAIVRMLLDNGADADAKADGGLTPLYCLVSGKSAEERIILKDSIEGQAKNQLERLVLQTAANHSIGAVLRMLIENGADINAQSIEGLAPLHSAVQKNSFAIVQLLLDEGADINAGTKDEHTPLNVAIYWSDVAVVQLLLDKGAKIDAVDDLGETALHDAAYAVREIEGEDGLLAIIRLLLERGADTNAKTKEGQTALDIAKDFERDKIIKLLETAMSEEKNS